MNFLQPLYVALVAIVAIPVLIHLFGKERAQPIRFGAMELLVAAQQEVAQKNRIRRWLLLAVRVLAIAAIPLALAQPFLMTPVEGPAFVGGVQSAVIVIDDSASMGADVAGSPLHAAKVAARQLVDAVGADSDVALLRGGHDAEAPIKDLVRDRGKLLAAIDAIATSSARDDLVGAVRRAAQILEQAARPRRVVYLISDFQNGALPESLPRGAVEIVPVVVGDKARKNHAITGLSVEPAPELGPRAARIAVEVAAYGDAARGLPLSLRIDDQPIAQSPVDVAPGTRELRKFTHVFALPELGKPDVHRLTAELPLDGLPADDRRYAEVVVERSVRVLLVDGDARTQRREDELFYVETALRAAGGFELTTITPDQLSAALLAAADVAVLCNVRTPPPALLQAFLDRGGGLLIAMGGNVDPDAYNQALAAVLPQPIQAMRTVARTRDARRDGEVVESGGALTAARIGRIDRAHPIFSTVADVRLDEELRAAQFGRFALLRPTEQPATALLSFVDQAPLLVERRIGKGASMLFASTLDRDWNDLVIQPLFLPLLQRMVLHLGRVAQSAGPSSVLIGQRIDLFLPERTTRVEVKPPQGAVTRVEPKGLVASYGPTTQLGFHAVALSIADERSAPRAELDFAVNLDSRESDVTRLTDEQIAKALAREGSKIEKPADRRIELWHLLGAALLALLLMESLLVRRK